MAIFENADYGVLSKRDCARLALPRFPIPCPAISPLSVCFRLSCHVHPPLPVSGQSKNSDPSSHQAQG